MPYSFVSFKTVASIMVLGLLASPGHTDTLELSQGAMLSNSCAGCHGTDGHSPDAIPMIAGKSADFIKTALLEFRADQRPGTVMGRHAKGYTDEEIQLIADFFSSRQ